jgi:hypothetical protein
MPGEEENYAKFQQLMRDALPGWQLKFERAKHVGVPDALIVQAVTPTNRECGVSRPLSELEHLDLAVAKMVAALRRIADGEHLPPSGSRPGWG